MCVGLWCLTAVFASATADAETDGKCHRGQARRARQEPDALRVKREITVFPALAQTYTKNHQRPDADAGVRRVCGIYGVQRMRNGINHTVSPLGRVGWEQMRSCAEQLGTDRESDQALPARGRFGRLGGRSKRRNERGIS